VLYAASALIKQEAQLTIAEKAARRSVSDWNIGLLLFYTNNANRSDQSCQAGADRVSEAVSATATFYSATRIVLYTHRCSRPNYCTASMQCRASHQQTSVQPNLLMLTGVWRDVNADGRTDTRWQQIPCGMSTASRGKKKDDVAKCSGCRLLLKRWQETVIKSNCDIKLSEHGKL